LNSTWSRSSRSSTVASRLGPGGGGVFSFSGLGGVSSFAGLSSVVMVAAGKLLIMGDHWRAVMSSIWNPTSSAAMVMAFLITGRMASTYWGKQSLSTTWLFPAKQSILCTMTGTGKRHGIRTGRSGGGSVRLHVTVERGVRGILLDRLDRSDGVPLVPRLPQFSPPLLATPICVGQSTVHFRSVVHRWGSCSCDLEMVV